MKKILFSILAVAITAGAYAQDAADKTFQAGLIFGSGINMQKMGTKLMNNNGAGSDWTIGANGVFSFNETIGLCTGVEFDFETTKFAPGTNPVFYVYDDNTILSLGSVVNHTNAQLYQLNARKQKSVYLTVPIMAQFRTNFIGYFRYFGKFGLRNSFLLSTKINDEGFNFTDNNIAFPVAASNENMQMEKKDVFFFKSAVGICGGAEWNFTGSTCLVAEIGYYYGFTPLYYNRQTTPDSDATAENPYKGVNASYISSGINNGIGNDIIFNNTATQSQLQFKVSILF